MSIKDIGKPLNGITKDAARKWLADLRRPLAKTTSERVQAMRAARDALGLKRLELYAHPDDWPAIKALAEKLQRRRAKLAAPRAG